MLHLNGRFLQKFHRSHLDVVLEILAGHLNTCTTKNDLYLALSNIYGEALVLNTLTELLIDGSTIA